MNEIALRMKISTMTLKKQLLKDNILKTDANRGKSYQNYKKIGSDSKNMYEIPLSKIYPFVAVRMHHDEFPDASPFKIPFGINDEHQIYFCINKNEYENCNMYVSGISGSGKSYAIKKFAAEASRQGFEVLNIGLEGSVIEFDETNYVEVSDGYIDETITARDVFSVLEREKLSEQCRSILKILGESIGNVDIPVDLKKWEDEFLALLDWIFEKEPVFYKAGSSAYKKEKFQKFIKLMLRFTKLKTDALVNLSGICYNIVRNHERSPT